MRGRITMAAAAAGLAAAALAGGAGGAAAQMRDDVTVAIQLEPPNLDPTSNAAQAVDSVLYANVLEGLTRIRADGSVAPALAARWDVSADGTEYTFHLQGGVTFHDGTAMDADDVVFTLERARAEGSTNAQKDLFEGIASVDALDPLTVRVTLERPDGAFPFKMAWGDAVIVAPESAGALAAAPVGTGPFRLARWARGDRIELERFDGYWGEAPALARATFRFIADPSAAFAAVMAQDVDAFVGFPAPENLAQFEADPRFQVLVGTTEGETILAMNNARPPFDDARVREAVALAIDRQEIIDGAQYGYGTPIGTHFAPHHPDYVDLLALSPHDPARARALLKEAGLPDGFETTLKLPPPSYARRGGEIAASQLAEVGISARIENVEWAQWIEEVFTRHDFDLTIVSHTEPMDIGIYARPDYYLGYANAELGAVMEELGAATDPAARSALLRRAQAIIAEDHAAAFLFELAVATVADARLRGLWQDQPTAAVDLTGVSWAQ